MCNNNSTTPPPTPTPIPTPSITQTMKNKKRKKKTQTKKQPSTNKKSSSTSNSFSSSSSSSSSSSLKPLKRRNRTKTRKPKYLSLRLQLSQNQKQPKKTTNEQPQEQQNLFSFQTELDNPEENNVALLFSSDGGATLTGLLEEESTTVTAATSDEGSMSAMTCPAMEGLVRKAMRRRMRSDEGSEERWVFYSEVVEERKETMEEVNSVNDGVSAATSFGSLSLKLDHEGILNAWSDKGPLYVAGDDEGPQIVPDLMMINHSFLNALPPNVGWDGYGCDVGGNLWKVPEANGGMSMKEEMGVGKLGQREASVLRYKEKRQNRLFAKRIRYEVRKLNAEKRPRMKGRFVKR